MTPLACFLALVLGITVLSFLLLRRWLGPTGDANPRSLFLLHAWIVTLILVAAVIYFLGWGPGVAPAGRDRPPYRLAHSGYYVTPGEELIFQSGRADRSFRLASLGEGERLALTAQPTEGSDRLRWTLRAEIDEIPLRVDGRQINLPAESWFQPGDQLVVRDLRGDRFFSVRWLADPGRSGAMSNRYLYNQGQLRDGNSVEDLEAPLLISQRLLREGYRLSSLAGSGIAEAIDRLRQPDRERRSSWLGSLFGTAGEEVPKLTAGVDVDAFEKRYRGLAPLFRQVLWLRQNLGDPASPMGVHLAGDLRDQDLYEVLRVRPGGQSHGLGQGSVGLLERALDPGSRVRLGFGSRDSVVLRPGATVVQDSRLGLVADLRIGNPASWPFPETQPAEVMIMSREILAQVHGFHLDVGLDREPFYAKVRYVTADDRFEVHDGKDLLGTSRVSGQPPSVFAGKRFRLGGFQRGVVLHFADQRSPVRFSGRWAMLALLVANVLFSLSWRGEASSRPKLDLAWTLIWGLMLTFLVVRLILAFRVAVLPPEDASPALIRTVFEQSLIVSLGAVWLVPPVVVGARLLARISWTAVGRWLSTRLGAGRMRAAAATRIRGLAARLPLSSLGHRLHPHGLPLPPRFLLFACLLVLWLSAAVVVGRNEALAGLRINIVVHLLLAFGLAAAAGWLVSARWTGRVLFLVLWFAVPTVVVILLIGDTGFGIHLFSFLLVALLLLPWGKQYLRWWAWVVLGVLVVGVVLPLAHPQILTAPRIDRWITKAVNPASHHVYYRLAVRGSEDELLRRRSEEAEYDLDLFLRNSQQQWQMLLYASEGLVGPRGYGGAPLSRAGMTYPSSLTDCVYSIYLLAEHGSAAAVLLVLAYAAMGALMIHGGWFFVDRGRHSHRSRLLVLTLVGGYFALNTLYMALANLGELVFTGQNIPLLALYSRSDILASAFLLCLVSFLLRFRLAVSDDQALPGQPLTRRFGYAYIAVFAAGVGLVALQMQTLAGDHSTRSDFSFPEATLDEYRQNLPEPGKAKPLQLDRRALRIQVQGKLSWVEEQYVRKFNHQLDKFDPVAGLYYLVSPSSGPQLQINGDYFNLPSPFRKRSRWEGTIEAQGPELPTLNLLGEEVVIQPMVETPGETFSLTDPPRDRVRLSNRVVLAHGSGPEAASLIELLGDRQTLSIDPYQPPPWMKWEIHVDGEEVTGVSQIRPLEKGQIIRITGSQSGTPFAYNLIYLGPQRPLLAFSTWRNGKTRRVLAEGSMAGTLRELGLVLDREKARHTKLPERLLLTLDAALHRRLEGILATEAERVYTDDSRRSHRRKSLALTVLDAHTGEVLAMPAWPIRRQGDGSPRRRHGERTEAAASFLINRNLQNHLIGSAVKPMLFSAVAAGLWPAGFDLAGLSVARHDSDCDLDDNEDARHAHCELCGVVLEPFWDCRQTGFAPPIDSRKFLYSSVNFYAGVVGMLGMMLDPEDWRRVLERGTGNVGDTVVLYRNQSYTVDLARAPAMRTSFTFDDEVPRPKKTEIAQSLLLRSLPELFGVEVGLQSADQNVYDAYLQSLANDFFPGLSFSDPNGNRRLESATPQLINIEPGTFHNTRGSLISLFLGGGPGPWNNVRLAEAAARIATGTQVIARLATSDTEGAQAAPPPFAELSEPISKFEWRNSSLLEPMRLVGLEGTAKALGDLVRSVEADGYRLLFKTGTIEENPPPRRSRRRRYESEMLMFVFGKWSSTGFERDRTLAGFFYMQDSKRREERDGLRIDVAREVLRVLKDYLDQCEAAEIRNTEA